MNLFDNPIFLTQKRLVHRAGVLAAILVAALIGLSFVSGLIGFMSGATHFYFPSNEIAGRVFYGWVIAMEIIILPIAGTMRIVRALSEDRKTGLWESNRMTPLRPAQLVMGYWLGAPLREVYAGVVFALCGLVIVVLAGLPIKLWLGTQVLVASATLFFGLVGVLAGLAAQRSEGGPVLFLMLLVLVPVSMAESRLLETNYILPIFGIANLFTQDSDGSSPWFAAPTLFGVAVPAIIFTIGLQLILGFFLWRAVTRKAAEPFRPMLLRWEALALLGVLLLAQNGLMWETWHGNFSNDSRLNGDVIGLVHGGTLLVGALLLALASAPPEQVRLAALRLGQGGVRLVLAKSAVPQAVFFALIAGLFLSSQFIYSTSDSWMRYVIAVINLLDFFLIFTLLLEYCRLNFRAGVAGFMVLGLFIVCILPFILAGVFSDSDIGSFSLLSPGVQALTDTGALNQSGLLWVTLLHLGIAGLLFIGWYRAWRRLLLRAWLAQQGTDKAKLGY